MKRLKKRPITGLGLGLVLEFLAGVIIWKVPPNNWQWEALVVGLVAGGIFVITAWVGGSKKWALVATLAIVGSGVINRFDAWDGTVIGLALVILGLISLIN